VSGLSNAEREAAARALDIVGQVQVFGLASAAAVAERYIGTVDRYLAEHDAPVGTSEDDRGRGSPDLMWAACMEQALMQSLDRVGAWQDDVRLKSRTPRQEILRLPPVPAGSDSRAAVWVHNPTTAPVVLTVRMSSLTSADGAVLPADEVVVETGGSVEVDAGGSAQVMLHVQVPSGTRPGHFHAVLTSTATPRQALPVLLEVLTAEVSP